MAVSGVESKAAVEVTCGATEVDIYRDTPVRFLGYTNEIGESFKPMVPRAFYLGSYAVACTYVAADAKHKYDADGDARHGVDALIWQSLASVAVPGLVVNRVVALTGKVTARPLAPTRRQVTPFKEDGSVDYDTLTANVPGFLVFTGVCLTSYFSVAVLRKRQWD